jgi:hypothetical protein
MRAYRTALLTPITVTDENVGSIPSALANKFIKMITKYDKDFFVGKKLVSWESADFPVDKTPPTFSSDGAAMQFLNDDLGHRSEIFAQKSDCGKYVNLEFVRTINDPNQLAYRGILLSVEQIAFLDYAFSTLASEEIVEAEKKLAIELEYEDKLP